MADLISLLLVEDDIFDIEAVERAVNAVHPPVFNLSKVTKFREALQSVKVVDYHVVILDLGLPDCSGLDGLSRLMAAIPNVPIIVMTGLHDDEVALRAIELGAQEFIEKGNVGPKQLVRAIRHAAKRKQHATRAFSEHAALSSLESIIRETTNVVCSRVDRLKKTDLTNEQESLVVQIDEKSKAALNRVNAMGASDGYGAAKDRIDLLSD